ncbi:MAG: anti-sigma factor antagonist, partial [Ruminiclostridium sp.]|nr:anti-sigma factor antagonist [Ruminiclostridium sp.]
MELTIKTERRKNKLVVSLAGKLTYTSAPEFDSAFADLAEDITGIRIDMSELHYLSSAGIRAIMFVKKMTTKRDITFEIAYPSETVMDVFSATGLDKVVTIITSEAEEDPDRMIYPLRPVQRWMIDTHFMKARSTMMNTGGFLKLELAVDMKILARAVNAVTENHDIFRCRLVMNTVTGELGQRFDGELEPVTVEIMTSEEFEKIKPHLRTPYEIIDHQLWNIRLIET